MHQTIYWHYVEVGENSSLIIFVNDCRPFPFSSKGESALFCLSDLFLIIIKLESNEIRKSPVIFLPFLNLKILFQATSSLKIF